MFYEGKIWIGMNDKKDKISIVPKMANRHGLIAGATGTGKTVTLKVLAESFSDAGVPVFLADIKGDLSGMISPGEDSENMRIRREKFGLDEAGYIYKSYPTAFWDIFGENGIPLRATVSEMGPILMGKIMNLNDTQSDILSCLFKMSDDRGLLLVDLKDLKAMLQYASENAAELSLEYGNISKQSVAAIIRAVVALEAAGGERFFSEPAVDITDFFKTAVDGRGVINILDGRRLVNDPKLYSAFLLYLIAELYELLPEVGDLDRPRMVFFFDEAHLLFNDISKSLEAKLEQTVKLIRSKGVGIYFITQSPRDIPDGVLGQLGNKIQHALRAYTPSEQKAIKVAAQSFTVNPEFDTQKVLSELGTGEALISTLDEDGIPIMVEKCSVLAPVSLMGPADEAAVKNAIISNNLYLSYKDAKETDSAYEYLERLSHQRELAKEEELKAKAEAAAEKARQKEEADKEKRRLKEEEVERKAMERAELAAQKAAEKEALQREKEEAKKQAAKYKTVKKAANSAARSAAGTVGRSIGQSIGESVAGDFGKKVGGNVMSQLGRSLLGNLFK